LTVNPLFEYLTDTPTQQALEVACCTPEASLIKGSAGSGLSLQIAAAYQNLERHFLVVFDQAETAAYYLNDFEGLLGEKRVLFFPSSYREAYKSEATDNANVLLRAAVLRALSNSKIPRLVVTYTEAIFEKIISQKTLKKNTLALEVGAKVSLDFINETLFEYGFERVDFVSSPGEFAVRGGIVDVFSFAAQHPYRIEFFDDEVESLRSFDIVHQLSIETHQQIDILPNTSAFTYRGKRKSILTRFKEKGTVFIDDPEGLCKGLDALYQKAEAAYSALGETVQLPPEALFVQGDLWLADSQKTPLLFLQPTPLLPHHNTLQWSQQPQPAINKHFDRLVEHLNANHQQGWTNYLCCTHENQRKRFHDIFQEMDTTVHYKTLVLPLYEGFEAPGLNLACYTDHQIFERYHKYRLRAEQAKKQVLSLQELTLMQVGDYVTHIDHGIGKFGGLQHIEVEGQKQEAIKLIYGERDILYLSIHALHKISKYNGKDGYQPKLYKLGSKAWKALKQKTKSRVKEIAFNLIQTYAKRKEKNGFRFAPDSYLQWELEASFLYEDTPDQSKATAAVKADMESERPMDRLICGDVGFGKTEVAIRAAFKAVDNSKQVAVLVPTTILAFQHFKTFAQRLADLPVRVDYLNRFRTAADKKQILHDLKTGKIDILIGTHQLVNSQVVFKDLGLLIVDEEQKFGVGVKEKIRALKTNIDVLTLTATPIPRTLQFSLMAARDLSVIATPPSNRYPIESEVIRFDETLLRDGILYELQRGGQVYVVHNRVANITEVAGMIQRLVPDARVAIGHGQMEGNKMEQVLLQFMEGQFDVLVATTIIENGLDVPNANTIFINNAHQFGLSDLHQMRGRVGRSNKKAFCYFITPPYSSLTADAQKRIKTIEQFAALGSGMQIAMRDLEIRGAGDLLGGEQSGFINEIGFDAYQKILEEALEELQANEFKSLFSDSPHERPFVREVQLDTDFEALIPEHYVNVVSERLTLYSELSKVNSDEALKEFADRLIDRFGPLPLATQELLATVALKGHVARLGIERLLVKKGSCLAYFIADQQSPFYQSPLFGQLIQQVQKHPTQLILKEKQTRNGLRLLLRINQVTSMQKLLSLFETYLPVRDFSNS